MSRLTIWLSGGTRAEIETSPAMSLLNALQRAGINVGHVCGGRAHCGTCRVRVVAGRFSPLEPREQERLARIGASPEERLACQAYAAGDAVIEL